MAKQFLDSTGLSQLWARICAGFAPTWKAVDLATINSAQTADSASIIFKSVGTYPDKDTVEQGTLALPVASADYAGIITNEDYKKLQNLSTTIDGKVPLTAVKIGNSALQITDKAVNFNLVYNNTTRTLDLVDANNSDDVKTSVAINDFVGDALLSSTLTNAVIVNKDNNNTAGTFLKLTFSFTEVDGTTRTEDVYANVADLVSTYTEGEGITISKTGDTIGDGNATALTISLKKAAVDTIGGVKVSRVFTTATDPTIQAATETASRYYPVELTSTGQAIVNIPEDTVQSGTGSTTTGSALTHGGSITVVDSLTITGNTVAANKVTYTLPTVPDLGVSANTKTTSTATHGGTIDVISAIAQDGHGIKYTPSTITLPSETQLSTADSSGADVTLKPGTTESAAVLETISVNGHVITRKTKNISVADPESISNDTIAALAYPGVTPVNPS